MNFDEMEREKEKYLLTHEPNEFIANGVFTHTHTHENKWKRKMLIIIVNARRCTADDMNGEQSEH